MAQVLLSIGSNIDREYFIGRCLDQLAQAYGAIQISSIYESEAVGFDGDRFYNLVVGLQTGQSLEQLFGFLRQTELDNDRCRNAVKFSSRTLDIDILSYDDYIGQFRLQDGSGGVLPRDEITKNAFVLQPLAEIAPDQLHPLLQVSYRQLWQDYDQDSQSLWPVSFIWQGRQLSSI
ncbi:MAG: 2-amino-4-hydroxy-6-hydroxymethyldihydropteridine diphosphokinase [Motiliproteus sp.]